MSSSQTIKSLFEQFWEKDPQSIVSHNFAASIILNKYQNDCKCTSQRQPIWYLFQNHRWNEIEEWQLKKKFTDELIASLQDLITDFQSQNGDCSEKYIQLAKLVNRLHMYHFTSGVMRECYHFFYDKDLLSSLDRNQSLIGFENGVYDIEKGEFREGRREDYLSFSVGYDYRTFRETDTQVLELQQYLLQLFENTENVNRAINTSSQILKISPEPQTLKPTIVWYGRGSNGKSGFCRLHQSTLGPYLLRCPFDCHQKFHFNGQKVFKCTKCIYLEEDWNQREIRSKDVKCNQPNVQLIYCTNTLPHDELRETCHVIEFPSRFVSNPDPKNPLEFRIDYHYMDHVGQFKEAFMFLLLEELKKVN